MLHCNEKSRWVMSKLIEEEAKRYFKQSALASQTLEDLRFNGVTFEMKRALADAGIEVKIGAASPGKGKLAA